MATPLFPLCQWLAYELPVTPSWSVKCSKNSSERLGIGGVFFGFFFFLLKARESAAIIIPNPNPLLLNLDGVLWECDVQCCGSHLVTVRKYPHMCIKDGRDEGLKAPGISMRLLSQQNPLWDHSISWLTDHIQMILFFYSIKFLYLDLARWTQFRWSLFYWQHAKRPNLEPIEHMPSSLHQAWSGCWPRPRQLSWPLIPWLSGRDVCWLSLWCLYLTLSNPEVPDFLLNPIQQEPYSIEGFLWALKPGSNVFWGPLYV